MEFYEGRKSEFNNRKKIESLFVLLMVVVLLFTSGFNTRVFAQETEENKQVEKPLIDARAAVLIEPVSGKIIYEQNSDDQMAPASITKVMTILLIYEAIEEGKIKLDDIVTTSAYAAGMGGSQIFLEEGEQQTVKDLLKSIVIASANDSSVAMAEFIAGTEESFVEMMNNRALELGMFNTKFQNACGLDTENHYSSAYDVALMSRALILGYPQVEEFSTTWYDTIIHKTKRGSQEFGLTNTNKLINNYNGITGLKTGSTSKALYCLSATAKRDEMELVAVILGAPNPAERFVEAGSLLDYGFANYTVSKGDEKGTVKGQVKVLKGEEEFTDVAVSEDVAVLVEKGNKTSLDTDVEILEGLNAPVLKGTKAGEVIYSFAGREVARVDLITTQDIDVASFPKILQKLFRSWTNFTK